MDDIQACRNPISSLWRDAKRPLGEMAHAGLLLSRYLEKQDEKREGIRTLLSFATDIPNRAAEIYRPAYERWVTSLDEAGYLCAKNVFSIRGRLVVGLGGDSVLETGLTLHHTYGTPVIPGSALKGLATHFCDQVWGMEDAEFKRTVLWTDDTGSQQRRAGNYFREIFGVQEDAGHILFHDAWATPGSLGNALQLDVLTSHHRDYYSTSEQSDAAPPTDCDDPNPVAFLSITGNLLVALSCDVPGTEGRKWLDLSFELVRQALRAWGIGGKTSSGYGRMEEGSLDSGVDQAGAADERSGPVTAKEPIRKYQGGERVVVTRVADTKKGKKRFQADDGLTGVVSSGEV